MVSTATTDLLAEAGAAPYLISELTSSTIFDTTNLTYDTQAGYVEALEHTRTIVLGARQQEDRLEIRVSLTAAER